MTKVEIYTINTCPYCVKAKSLLNNKGIKFEEIDVSNDEKLRTEMMEKANGCHTVLQIFINDESIGGCDNLYKLDKNGKLDSMLENK